MRKKRIYYPNGVYVDIEIDEDGNEIMPEVDDELLAKEEKIHTVFEQGHPVK